LAASSLQSIRSPISRKVRSEPVPEGHHLPLPIGQPANRHQQLREEDPILGDLRGVGTGAQAPADLLLDPVAHPGPAMQIKDHVARDPEEPGRGRRRRRLEAVIGPKGVDEDLGRHVLRLCRIAKLGERVPVDPGQELSVEVLELGARGHAASW